MRHQIRHVFLDFEVVAKIAELTGVAKKSVASCLHRFFAQATLRVSGQPIGPKAHLRLEIAGDLFTQDRP